MIQGWDMKGVDLYLSCCLWSKKQAESISGSPTRCHTESEVTNQICYSFILC